MALALFLLAALIQAVLTLPPVPLSAVHVIHSWPHDSAAVTEGITLFHDRVYESTGIDLFGAASLRSWTLSGDSARHSRHLPGLFAEGLDLICNRTVIQATRFSRQLIISDAVSLAHIKTIELDIQPEQEIWGVAALAECSTDSATVFLSNGTSWITELDLQSGRVLSEWNTGVSALNELEFMGDGTLWANVWGTKCIAAFNIIQKRLVYMLVIDPEQVSEASGGLPIDSTMNGIAYDPITDKIYVAICLSRFNVTDNRKRMAQIA